MIIRRNVSWVANQHIQIISEASCDTEENWSNDAENLHKLKKAARSHPKVTYTDKFDNAYTSNAHGTL